MTQDRHPVGRGQRLDGSPDRQVSFRLPLAVDQRLDALVERAVDAASAATGVNSLQPSSSRRTETGTPSANCSAATGERPSETPSSTCPTTRTSSRSPDTNPAQGCARNGTRGAPRRSQANLPRLRLVPDSGEVPDQLRFVANA